MRMSANGIQLSRGWKPKLTHKIPTSFSRALTDLHKVRARMEPTATEVKVACCEDCMQMLNVLFKCYSVVCLVLEIIQITKLKSSKQAFSQETSPLSEHKYYR